MSVAQTSIRAYESFRDSPKLSTQQRMIIEFLRNRPATRGEIAEGTGIRLSSTCGRVAELLKSGAIEDCGCRPCAITGITAKLLRLVPAQQSLDLAA